MEFENARKLLALTVKDKKERKSLFSNHVHYSRRVAIYKYGKKPSPGNLANLVRCSDEALKQKFWINPDGQQVHVQPAGSKHWVPMISSSTSVTDMTASIRKWCVSFRAAVQHDNAFPVVAEEEPKTQGTVGEVRPRTKTPYEKWVKKRQNVAAKQEPDDAQIAQNTLFEEIVLPTMDVCPDDAYERIDAVLTMIGMCNTFPALLQKAVAEVVPMDSACRQRTLWREDTLSSALDDQFISFTFDDSDAEGTTKLSCKVSPVKDDDHFTLNSACDIDCALIAELFRLMDSGAVKTLDDVQTLLGERVEGIVEMVNQFKRPYPQAGTIEAEFAKFGFAFFMPHLMKTKKVLIWKMEPNDSGKSRLWVDSILRIARQHRGGRYAQLLPREMLSKSKDLNNLDKGVLHDKCTRVLMCDDFNVDTVSSQLIRSELANAGKESARASYSGDATVSNFTPAAIFLTNFPANEMPPAVLIPAVASKILWSSSFGIEEDLSVDFDKPLVCTLRNKDFTVEGESNLFPFLVPTSPTEEWAYSKHFTIACAFYLKQKMDAAGSSFAAASLAPTGSGNQLLRLAAKPSLLPQIAKQTKSLAALAIGPAAANRMMPAPDPVEDVAVNVMLNVETDLEPCMREILVGASKLPAAYHDNGQPLRVIKGKNNNEVVGTITPAEHLLLEKMAKSLAMRVVYDSAPAGFEDGVDPKNRWDLYGIDCWSLTEELVLMYPAIAARFHIARLPVGAAREWPKDKNCVVEAIVGYFAKALEDHTEHRTPVEELAGYTSTKGRRAWMHYESSNFHYTVPGATGRLEGKRHGLFCASFRDIAVEYATPTTELADAKQELADKDAELTDAKQELAAKDMELAAKVAELDGVKKQLADFEHKQAVDIAKACLSDILDEVAEQYIHPDEDGGGTISPSLLQPGAGGGEAMAADDSSGSDTSTGRPKRACNVATSQAKRARK